MITKQQFVRRVLDLVQDHVQYDAGTAMSMWWQDPRDNGGWRLTDVGHKLCQQALIDCWHYDIDPHIPTRPLQLIMLKKYLGTPYHLRLGRKPSITFYSSREATMYGLYDHIDRFVQALKRNQHSDS